MISVYTFAMLSILLTSSTNLLCEVPSVDTIVLLGCIGVYYSMQTNLLEAKKNENKFEGLVNEIERQASLIRKLYDQRYKQSADFYAMEAHFEEERAQWKQHYVKKLRDVRHSSLTSKSELHGSKTWIT